MSHTPGPWEVCSRSVYQIDAVGGREVVHGNGIKGRGDDMERDANAHLIAAAPDMLAALKDIVEGCSFPDDDVQRAIRDRARVAIAKAEPPGAGNPGG